ncbi:MAG TPA: serine hydrolase domain-containing protein [Cyclobacteriaceae bacterium]|nr:serine hydrolase domain-containing protein [Cyclobacteriaceae bacterium]
MKNLPLLFLTAACLFACSAPEKKETVDPLVASLDSLMQSAVDTARFNGNVLVARNGQVVYKKSFGPSNFYTNEMLNDSTMFELASVSKAFTAMGIMMLKEQGKLSYDDDVTKYLPELSYKGMTIRHFLQHTSGIADYGDVMLANKWDVKKIAHNSDIIESFKKLKPAIVFKPGEKWEYSNTAYAMLATIIERVSGKPYSEFLAENIFKPLDMKRSRTYNTRRSGEVIPNYAYGFVYSDSLKKYALPDSLKEYYYVYPLDGIEGDGIVNSTTGDLFKWNEALYTDKLVSRASIEEAFTSGKLNNDSLHNYGFGWFIENDSVSGKIVRHTGSWPGYRNLIVRFVDNKDCIIILTNNENPSARTMVGNEIKKRLARYRQGAF